MGDNVFVTSIQHTGTWFVLNFLKRFMPNIVHTFQVIDNYQIIEKGSIIHCHFSGINTADFNKGLSLGGIVALASLFKTVVPVRDPLAAILTRESRHPEQRHFYIPEGFVHLSQTLQHHPNVKFLPIDLKMTQEQRYVLLKEVLEHVGIDPIPAHDILMEISTEWNKENPTPGNRFVSLYEARDMDQITFLLGPKQAEVEYLKNSHVLIFTQFLEKLGYKREDLLW